MVREYKERRDITVEALNDIPRLQCIKPKATFYLFPNVQRLGLSSANLTEQMLKKAKVATILGSAFGPSGEGHLRMSIAVSKKDLLKAVKRIKNFVKALPSHNDR
jgi:aspartate/methionine/tyrosine aminotransferase